MNSEDLYQRICEGGLGSVCSQEVDFTILKILKYTLHEEVVIFKPENECHIIKTNQYLWFKLIAVKVKKRPQL